jgi:hypothetical protein
MPTGSKASSFTEAGCEDSERDCLYHVKKTIRKIEDLCEKWSTTYCVMKGPRRMYMSEALNLVTDFRKYVQDVRKHSNQRVVLCLGQLSRGP